MSVEGTFGEIIIRRSLKITKANDRTSNNHNNVSLWNYADDYSFYEEDEENTSLEKEINVF